MIDERFEQFQAQIDRRFNGVHESIEANTVLTMQADDRSRRIEANTQTLVEIFDRAGKSATLFANTARFLRKAAVWLGPFLALGGGIWALAQGKWPGQS